MPTVLRTTTIALQVCSTLALGLVGCASTGAGAVPSSSAPIAAPASSESAPKHAAAPVQTLAQDDQAAAAPGPASSDTPAPSDQPGDGLRKASRPPLELLTGNNVVYVLNFASSAIGASTKQQCESQNADPGAARECEAKERGKIPIESIRFVKDASGQYWWVTFNRYRGNLLKWHRIQFLPGKQDADSVSLTLTGKDKGIAPMTHVPASLKIELPNDYSIVVSDPDYGAMLYDAKIGLMEPEKAD
jgi:hypothetical protein